MAVHVTGETFEQEVVQSSKPVLVDFYATWCGPCKMIGPIIDQISDEMSDRAKVVKVDVDQARDLASKFKVMSVPTLMIFKDGQMVDQILGAVPKDRLIEKLESHL
jgi:thioredoxin 1